MKDRVFDFEYILKQKQINHILKLFQYFMCNNRKMPLLMML